MNQLPEKRLLLTQVLFASVAHTTVSIWGYSEAFAINACAGAMRRGEASVISCGRIKAWRPMTV